MQVAVDNEDQVVELFPGSQGNGAERFRFVHLAVTEHRPDLTATRFAQTTIDQIMVKARLVDGRQGRQPHGDGRKFPELFHQEGVGVGGESTFGRQLIAKSNQVLLSEAAFEEGPGIDSR